MLDGNNSPSVSVVILTKNRSASLLKALESVWIQDYPNFEVLVINDASDDGTDGVLKEKVQKYLHLRVITHNESKGITLSRQEGLMEARGELVAFLDDDDIWTDPKKLSLQVEFFEKNSNAVLLGTAQYLVGVTGAILGRVQRPLAHKQIRRTMLFRNNFFTSSVMLKKRAAIACGGFIKDEEDLAEDYDLWLRMGVLGLMGNLGYYMVSYKVPKYSPDRIVKFYKKQLRLVYRETKNYPFGLFAKLILKYRIWRLSN